MVIDSRLAGSSAVHWV